MNNSTLTEAALLQNWRPVIELTDQLRELAKQDDWEAVVALELKRQETIETFFKQPIPAQHQARMRAEIEKILHHDRELLQAGKTAREAITKQLSQFSQNRQAHKAYTSNSGNP